MRRPALLRRFVIVVAAVLAATSALWATAPIRVFANGKPVRGDVPPMLIKGATYLPLRATAEALGAKLEWEAKTKTAVLCTKNTCYPIRTGDPSSGAKLVQGRVLLPLRKAAEALGAQVSWNASAHRVDVTTKR